MAGKHLQIYQVSGVDSPSASDRLVWSVRAVDEDAEITTDRAGGTAVVTSDGDAVLINGAIWNAGFRVTHRSEPGAG
jgi:hypothetical protein